MSIIIFFVDVKLVLYVVLLRHVKTYSMSYTHTHTRTQKKIKTRVSGDYYTFQLRKDNSDNDNNSTVKNRDVLKFIVVVPLPVKK